MRTFIAVEISGEPREALLRYSQRLQTHDAKVRWVRPEQMHMTLKFLGEISEDQAAPISDALARIAEGAAPFEAEVRGLGGFPSLARPRVLWAGIEEGKQELVRLADQVEHEMRKLRFPKEKRGFTPHLTLGRVKSPKGLDPVCAKMQKDVGHCFGRFTVQEVVFFQSVLSPSGATYTVLGRHRLG